MKKKIRFIINPISGGKNKDFIPPLIERELDSEKYDADIWIWENVDTLTSQIESLKNQKYDGVIAVGGDGTINQLACELIGSGLFLGFVPMGSGNGLARQLNIPMDPAKAIAHINLSSVRSIDTALLNGKSFVNVAGVGFDAKVSKSFASSKKRGLLNYGRCVMQEYRNAGNENYRIEVDGEERKVEAFMLSIANGSQWGNNFFVAPDASLDDGLLDLVVMSKPKLVNIPKLLNDLSRQNVASNSLVEIIKGKSIIIHGQNEAAHVDGEPLEEADRFLIEVNPLSLKVLC